MNKHRAVLIVEEDHDLQEALSVLLVAAGYNCFCASSVAEASSLLHAREFSAVLCDYRPSAGAGREVLTFLRARFPNLALFVMSGSVDLDTPSARALGARDFIAKPYFTSESLVRKLDLG